MVCGDSPRGAKRHGTAEGSFAADPAPAPSGRWHVTCSAGGMPSQENAVRKSAVPSIGGEERSRRSDIGPGVVKRPCAIVAEDDPAMRELVVTTLRLEGFEVLEAEDGVDLLDKIGDVVGNREGGKDAVSVIVSDVRMPDFTGLDILAALRMAGWQTPMVLMTAFGDEATHAETANESRVVLLDKPFSMRELLVAARRVMRK